MHHLVICRICQYALTPTAEGIKNHFYQTHSGLPRPDDNVMNIVRSLDPRATADALLVTPPPNGPPVAGLKISNGFACRQNGCAKAFGDFGNFQAHCRREHSLAILNSCRSEYRCRYQSFQGQRNLMRPFKVVVDPLVDLVEQVQEDGPLTFDNVYRNVYFVRGPTGHRHEASFYTVSRWKDMLERLEDREGYFVDLVNPQLEAAVLRVFEQGTEFSRTAYAINRRLKPEDDHFEVVREDESHRRYGATAVKLVKMMLRLAVGKFASQHSDNLTAFRRMLQPGGPVDVGLLKSFLRASFFTQVPASIRAERSLLSMAVMMICVKEDGRFFKTLEISRHIAQVMYFSRLLGLVIINDESDVLYARNAPLTEVIRVEEEILKFFDMKMNSHLSMVYHVFGLLKKFNVDSRPPPVLWDINSGGQTVVAQNIRIELDDMKHAARTSIDKLKEAVEGMLEGFQFNIPDLVVDDFRNSEAGYSFATDPDNNFFPWQTRFREHLNVWANRSIRVLATKLSKWDELVKLLFVALHLTYGYPARGTEDQTARWQNSHGDSCRNLFISHVKLAFCPSYNKKNNVSGQENPIPRFAPKILRDLYITYIAIIRPNLIEIASLARVALDMQSSNMLYFGIGGLVAPQRLRETFRTLFTRWTGKKLTFQNHRQVFECFANYHLRERVPVDFHQMLSDQAGHSTRTAIEHYGDTTIIMSGITTDEMTRMAAVSQAWWDLLGLILIRARAVTRVEEAVVGRNAVVVGGDRVAGGGADDRVVGTEIVNFNDASLTSRPENYFNSNHFNMLLNMSLDTNTTPVRLQDILAVLDGFRRLEGTDQVTCCEQLDAAVHLRTSKLDAMVILPTGKGKTSVVLVNAIMEQKTTVFVVPLLALQDDIKRKCVDKGISVMIFDGETVYRKEKIVLVTVERATTDDFLLLLSSMQATLRLQRIVIDEAHLILTWQGFRST